MMQEITIKCGFTSRAELLKMLQETMEALQDEPCKAGKINQPDEPYCNYAIAEEQPITNDVGLMPVGYRVNLWACEEVPSVTIYDLCGYDSVEFKVETPQEAQALYKALLNVQEIEED